MATNGNGSNPLGGTGRLAALLEELEKKLAERYAFDVFAKDAINFGVLITYRQKWEPQTYQVGDLVKTIPLAPKEVVRYTTKTVTKRSRAQKEWTCSGKWPEPRAPDLLFLGESSLTNPHPVTKVSRLSPGKGCAHEKTRQGQVPTQAE